MTKGMKTKHGKGSKKHKKPTSDVRIDNAISSADSSANQQVQSRIMQLPQEIRDEIYAHIYCSTRFAFGERAFSRIDGRRIISSTHGTALALLRTCRRVRDEIGISWLHQVRFHFEQPEALLDKLAGIPITLRNQIRHVRVSGDPLMVCWEEDDVYYRTTQILKLLPGLELDTLTILGSRTLQVAYETLTTLIRHSDGWKELHYISHTSEFLGYKGDIEIFGPSDPMLNPQLRQPQPSDWQSALEQRDGKTSRPSVVVYRATDSTVPCAVLQPATREVFTQAFATGQNEHNFGKVPDTTLIRSGELEKEVLVVVKRGDGVDYAEKEGSPYLPFYIGDIREDCPGMTPGMIWKDIKAKWNDLLKNDFDDSEDESDDVDKIDSDDGSDDQSAGWTQRPARPVTVDTYSHVDEYTWPPLHFVKE